MGRLPLPPPRLRASSARAVVVLTVSLILAATARAQRARETTSAASGGHTDASAGEAALLAAAAPDVVAIGQLVTVAVAISAGFALVGGSVVLAVDALGVSAIDAVWWSSRFNALEAATVSPAANTTELPASLRHALLGGSTAVAAPLPLVAADAGRVWGALLLAAAAVVLHTALVAGAAHALRWPWSAAATALRWPHVTVRALTILYVGLAGQSWLLLFGTRRGGDGTALFAAGLGLLACTALGAALLIFEQGHFTAAVFRRFTFNGNQRPTVTATPLSRAPASDPQLRARVRYHETRLLEQQRRADRRRRHHVQSQQRQLEDWSDRSSRSSSSSSGGDWESRSDADPPTASAAAARGGLQWAPPGGPAFSCSAVAAAALTPAGFWAPESYIARAGCVLEDFDGSSCAVGARLVLLHATLPGALGALRVVSEDARHTALAGYFALFAGFVALRLPFRRRHHPALLVALNGLKCAVCVSTLGDRPLKLLVMLLGVGVILGAALDAATGAAEWGIWVPQECAHRAANTAAAAAESMEEGLLLEPAEGGDHPPASQRVLRIPATDLARVAVEERALRPQQQHLHAYPKDATEAAPYRLHDATTQTLTAAPSSTPPSLRPPRRGANDAWATLLPSSNVSLLPHSGAAGTSLDISRLDDLLAVEGLLETPLVTPPSYLQALRALPPGVNDLEATATNPMVSVRNALPPPQTGWEVTPSASRRRLSAVSLFHEDPGVQRRLAKYLNREGL